MLSCQCCELTFKRNDLDDLRAYVFKWDLLDDGTIDSRFCPECHIHINGLNMLLDEEDTCITSQ